MTILKSTELVEYQKRLFNAQEAVTRKNTMSTKYQHAIIRDQCLPDISILQGPIPASLPFHSTATTNTLGRFL